MLDPASERGLLKVGGASAVIGAIIALVGNAFHPRASAANLGNPEAFLRLITESPNWVTVHVAVIVSTLLFLGAQVALAHSLSRVGSLVYSRLALASALVGTITSLIDVGIDGVVMHRFAASWASAQAAERGAFLQAATVLYDLNFGLLSVTVMILFFGVPFILYGLAVSSSSYYPRWWGWVAVLGGIGSVLVGLLEAYNKQSALTFLVLFPILAALVSIWMLVVGVLMWRMAGAEV